MDWIKASAVNGALACISIIVAVFALEGISHLTSLRYRFLPPLEPQGYIRYDPELGFDITPNSASTTQYFADSSYDVSSNELGCFDAQFASTTLPYALLVGDSFAWGWTSLEDKWGKRIEALTGMRTLTCGVNAFGTRQELIKTQRLIARGISPELIIVGYLGGNDPDDDRHFPQYVTYDGFRAPSPVVCGEKDSCTVPELNPTMVHKVKFFLGRHSVLYSAARQYLHVEVWIRRILLATFPDSWLERMGVVHLSAPQSVEQIESQDVFHRSNMTAFKELARRTNAQLFVVLIPTKEEVHREMVASSSPNQKMRYHLEQEHIAYIDLLEDFRMYEKKTGESLYWNVDGHWNPAGNHLAGYLVALSLVEKHLLPFVDEPVVKESLTAALEHEFPLPPRTQ